MRALTIAWVVCWPHKSTSKCWLTQKVVAVHTNVLSIVQRAWLDFKMELVVLSGVCSRPSINSIWCVFEQQDCTDV